MTQTQITRLSNALAGAVALLLVWVVANAILQPGPGQDVRAANAAAQLADSQGPNMLAGQRARRFELSISGGFVRLHQDGYRTVHFRPTALTSFAKYEPGQGMADQYPFPVLFLKIAGHDYRLDCKDAGQAEEFRAFMITSEAAVIAEESEEIKEIELKQPKP